MNSVYARPSTGPILDTEYIDRKSGGYNPPLHVQPAMYSIGKVPVIFLIILQIVIVILLVTLLGLSILGQIKDKYCSPVISNDTSDSILAISQLFYSTT